MGRQATLVNFLRKWNIPAAPAEIFFDARGFSGTKSQVGAFTALQDPNSLISGLDWTLRHAFLERALPLSHSVGDLQSRV